MIAATNRRLNELAAAGKFRQDLLDRLNGFVVPLPALRDRKEDITLLVDHFVRLANAKLGRQSRRSPRTPSGCWKPARGRGTSGSCRTPSGTRSPRRSGRC